MNTKITLDYQINRLGFWSAILVIVSGVVSMYLPLDIAAGATAEHADRVAWLITNRGAFIAGWVNQIVAMLLATCILFGITWQIRGGIRCARYSRRWWFWCPLLAILSRSLWRCGPYLS